MNTKESTVGVLDGSDGHPGDPTMKGSGFWTRKGLLVKFTGRRLVVTGIALGMVLSFLLSQPTLLNGFLSLTSYLYSFLPESLARFLRGQTAVTLAFFWGLMFLGMVLWIVRGDFFRAENTSRRDQFSVVDRDENREDADD